MAICEPKGGCEQICASESEGVEPQGETTCAPKSLVPSDVCTPRAPMLGFFLQMELLTAILPYAELTLSLLLILGIVLQQRGANLGGAFGGDNFASTFYKRRGAEKFLFNATIIVAILFVASAILGFLI
jgi:preprotein translocase subunit SecG